MKKLTNISIKQCKRQNQKKEQKPAFITIKDHKKGFPNKLNCRVLNPSKSPLKKFTKAKLDIVNTRTIVGSKLNQYKNTDSIINWFNKLKITPKTRFYKI